MKAHVHFEDEIFIADVKDAAGTTTTFRVYDTNDWKKWLNDKRPSVLSVTHIGGYLFVIVKSEAVKLIEPIFE